MEKNNGDIVRQIREHLHARTTNGSSDQDTGNGWRKPHYSLMSSIQPQPIDWLWKPWFALGEITVVDGDPGTNKSTFLVDTAARVSRGMPMPGFTDAVKGGVLLLVAEDSISKTLSLRLCAADADMDRVGVITRPISLPKDTGILEESVSALGARLVVLDPFNSFLGRDASIDQAVRQALNPLKQLAERSNAAVVLVRHLSKSGGKQALYRGLGSIAIGAAARSGLLIGKNPKDENLRVLLQYKNNLGLKARSLLFEPVESNGTVRIEWRGECDYQPEDLLAASKPGDRKLIQAVNFLTELLATRPVEQVAVLRKAVADGHAWRTVERAKEILDVRSRREGFGPGSRCLWALPAQDDGIAP